MELARSYSQITVATTAAGEVAALATATSGSRPMLHRLLVNAAGNGTVRIEATTASSVLGTTGNSALNGAQSIAANATLEYPFVSQKEGALKGVTGQALIIGSTATTLAGFAIVSNEST